MRKTPSTKRSQPLGHFQRLPYADKGKAVHYIDNMCTNPLYTRIHSSKYLQSTHSSLVHRLLRNVDVMRGRWSMRIYDQRVLEENRCGE
jgi:hypothetical protein